MGVGVCRDCDVVYKLWAACFFEEAGIYEGGGTCDTKFPDSPPRWLYLLPGETFAGLGKGSRDIDSISRARQSILPFRVLGAPLFFSLSLCL